MRPFLLLLLSAFAICAHGQAPADICERQIPANWTAVNGQLSLTSRHYKTGKQSVQWNWNNKAAFLKITDTDFLSVYKNNRAGFVIWIYNETPVNDKLKFEFGNGLKIASEFDFNLNFKGWRTAWVLYHRDMKGKPDSLMNTLIIKAPASVMKGQLFIDQVIYNYTINPRSPMQDAQVPFVNEGVEKAANAHWNALYIFSNTPHYMPAGNKITQKQKEDFAAIAKRFNQILIGDFSKTKLPDFDSLKKEYESWQIKYTGNVITGNPVYSMNDAELVPGSVNGKNVKLPFEVKSFTQLMLNMAKAYHASASAVEKKQLAGWFINLLNHLYDQGWAYGSGMGALHHLGYNFDGYYTACFLMKPEIKKAGLLQKTWQTMYWYSGLGRTQQKTELLPASNIDVFNTLLEGMLSTILIMDDGPYKLRQMQEFSNWLSANLLPNYSIDGAFKPDGAVFHHGHFYPAYAIGGFNGVTPIVYCLSNTSFQINNQAYSTLQKAMMLMFIYTHPERWPISVSGRHPTGNFKIPSLPYFYMALSGNQDNKTILDTSFAGAYLTIRSNGKADSRTKYFAEKGIKPLPHPAGHWNLNYGLFDIHRRQNWLLTVRGHNRYFVTHESYPNANVFGRYLTYGHLELLYPETKENSGSNFKDQGWDWNHIPGATTLYLPIQKLRANILNADDNSGVEEMLLSDEVFAGGTSLNNQGLFSMKLHGHDKYDMGSFRATKSWFMFDSLIICLGSNISNSINQYPTHTTVFQNVNKNAEPIRVNSKKINASGYEVILDNTSPLLVIDNRSTGYYIPQAKKIMLLTKEQKSRDQKDLRDTKGIFSTLIFDHGDAPENDQYEYAMLVNTNEKQFGDFTSQMSTANPVFKVLQKDSIAHRLFYAPLNMTAMAVFNKNTALDDLLIKANDKACLIMYQKENDTIEMSVTDPDLAFYTGPDDSPVVDGKRKEVSIYSRTWFTTPSKPSVVRLLLKGKWECTNDPNIKATISNDATILSIPCSYGIATKMKLQKIII